MKMKFEEQKLAMMTDQATSVIEYRQQAVEGN